MNLDCCSCGLTMAAVTKGTVWTMPLFACPRCDLLPERSRKVYVLGEQIARWRARQRWVYDGKRWEHS